MVWNPESTLVWNPESRRLESGIQRIEIQNPDAGIRNLEAGIRNPGPSWILLHRATRLAHFQRKIKWRLLGALRYIMGEAAPLRAVAKRVTHVFPQEQKSILYEIDANECFPVVFRTSCLFLVQVLTPSCSKSKVIYSVFTLRFMTHYKTHTNFQRKARYLRCFLFRCLFSKIPRAFPQNYKL